jgi:hypothetical protein
MRALLEMATDIFDVLLRQDLSDEAATGGLTLPGGFEPAR